MCREWETERERFPRHSRGKWTARCSFFLPLEYLYGTVAAAAAALPSTTADNKSTPREEYTSPVAVVDAFAAVAAFGVLQTFAPLLFHFHGTPIWRNFLWRPRLSQSVGGAIQKCFSNFLLGNSFFDRSRRQQQQLLLLLKKKANLNKNLKLSNLLRSFLLTTLQAFLTLYASFKFSFLRVFWMSPTGPRVKHFTRLTFQSKLVWIYLDLGYFWH